MTESGDDLPLVGGSMAWTILTPSNKVTHRVRYQDHPARGNAPDYDEGTVTQVALTLST
jgi:hypothetical protein